MFTEDDLRTVLDELEHEAPSTTAVLARFEGLRRRRRTRRRVLGVTAAAAVAAALVAVSIAVPRLLADGPPPAEQRIDTPRFGFAVADVPGHRVVYQSMGSKAQVAALVAENDPDSQHPLLVYDAGTYDPAKALDGEPVTIDGRSGYYDTDLPCDCHLTPGLPRLAWEYEPDAWAVAYHQGAAVPPAQAKLLLRTFAEAVDFDRSTPVRVPFRLGHLPDHLGHLSASVSTNKESQLFFHLYEDRDDDMRDPVLSIMLREPRPADGPDVVHEYGVQRRLNATTTLEILGSSRTSTDDLARIDRSFTLVGDRDDQNTWLTLDDALPAG